MFTLTLENIMFFLAAAFQLAAMIFTAKMMLEVKDRRPWILLFFAMAIMFVLRCLAIFLPYSARQHIGPYSAPSISILLFISLFSMRRIALAERDSENRYRQLVELSPDTIIVFFNDQIVYVNTAALKFLGAASREQLLGLAPLNLVAPESIDSVKQRLQALAHSTAALPSAEVVWKRLDGSHVHVEVVAASIPWQRGSGIPGDCARCI